MKNWRVNLVLFFIFLFSAAIISRLIYLQVLNYEFYRALAKGQQKIFARTLEDRGEIFIQDKDGNLYKLATNKDWPLVFASPKEMKSDEISSNGEKLAQILNLDKEIISEKLKQDSFYELLKNKLTDEEAEGLQKNKFPGIYLGKERLRYYPFGDFLSSVIGFVGGNGTGQYGIENYWNDFLQGKEKVVELERGIGQYLFSSLKNGAPGRGADVILTIDYNIQYQAEKILKKARSTLNIEGGEITVIDPNSGKITAMASFPGFDPNFYSEEEDLEIFQNAVIQKIFEPGSVFKPITMAAALDQAKVNPQTKYVDKGYLKIGGWPIYNYDGRVWGERTMAEVLEKSINTGAVFAESQIGHDVFLEYIKRFGIFEPTGIDLSGEIYSQNREFQKGYEINFATASFGQGIEMTPIQLVRAFCAIANGGKLVKPYVVEKIIPPQVLTGKIEEGKIIETKPEISREPAISQKTASTLVAMLVGVVENGYAKRAKIPGYYIAGKTGTAQIPWSALKIDKSGYSDKTIQSFVGFAPAYEPKFLILIKLNNPETKTAEYSAVPLFQELAKYIIDYYQIPPDYEL